MEKPSELSKLYEKELMESQYQADLASWNFHYNDLLNQIDGQECEKEEIIRKRILRYFGEFKLEEDHFFCLRIEGNFSSPHLKIVSNQLVVFGVDYLSIRRTHNYFQGLPTQIVRIDDSHYLVKFKNQCDCLQALNRKSIQQNKISCPKDLHPSNQINWIQMLPYYQFVFERRLMGRFRTNFDNFDNFGLSEKKSSILHAYSQAKDQFMKSLQKQLEKRKYLLRLANGKKKEKIEEKVKERVLHEQYIYRQPQRKGVVKKYQQQCQEYKEKNKYQAMQRKLQKKKFQQKGENWNKYSKWPKYQSRIQQSNLKFQLYIKNRDMRKVFHSNHNQFFKQVPQIKSNNYKNKKQLLFQGEQETKNPQIINRSNNDLEQILQKFHLGDSKDYSMFNVDGSNY